jgi:outer membrane protein TolC
MRRRLALLLTAAAAAGGCAALHPDASSVPPAAHEPWIPPPAVVPAPPPPAAVSTEALEQALAVLPGHAVDLPLALDWALRSSPRTRETWLAARAAAAEVESQRSAYYPDVNATGTALRQKGTVGAGQFSFQQTTLTPAADFSWLLLDFGGRAADVAETRQQLIAAGFTHNQAIQDVVLDVAQAYYRYVSARALRDAAQADLAEAKKNLEAAEGRHQAGLATVADELQAKTAVSTAQLALQQAAGDMQVIRGALATAMGLPPELPVDAAPLAEDVPVLAASETIGAALDRALAGRPDLLAARARIEAARARVARERADGLPTLTLSGSGNRIFYKGVDRDPATNYSALLQMRVPLFSGFEHHWDVERARAEAEQADAQADLLERQVRLQVFTSYYDLQTAAQRYATAQDLLAAADESARVAGGRYHEGVGSILDLLSAQSTLANARAQKILARADWLLALARLAHDTGTLGIAPPAPPQAPPTSDERPQ